MSSPAETSDVSSQIADASDARELFDLSGRIAVVTGATRGLGLAIAGAYSNAGAQIVVVSRKAQACEQVAA